MGRLFFDEWTTKVARLHFYFFGIRLASMHQAFDWRMHRYCDAFSTALLILFTVVINMKPVYN